MRIEAETVDEYISKAPENRQASLQLVVDRIKARTTGVEETLDHGMPYYRLDGDAYIAVASQKNHVSLYVVHLDDSLAEDEALAETFALINCGKNCLRVRDTQLDRLTPQSIDQLLDATLARI